MSFLSVPDESGGEGARQAWGDPAVAQAELDQRVEGAGVASSRGDAGIDDRRPAAQPGGEPGVVEVSAQQAADGVAVQGAGAIEQSGLPLPALLVLIVLFAAGINLFIGSDFVVSVRHGEGGALAACAARGPDG